MAVQGQRFTGTSYFQGRKTTQLRSLTVCRGVYESGEHQLFLERLEERIKKHDRDIEKMCSHHYQGKR
jgi:hypothetical protein